MDTTGLRRSIIAGIAVSSAVLFGGSIITMWATTGRLWDGLAVGAFCAVWGGPGFGAMFGAGFHALRREHIAAAAATPSPEPVGAAIPMPPVAGSGAWTV